MKPKVDWEQMANLLLDYVIDFLSPNEVAQILFDAGYSPETLEYLGFDEDTIAEIVAEDEEKLDDTMDRQYQELKDGE